MAEVHFVAKDVSTAFEGVFSLKGLYSTVDAFFDRYGFDKKEKKSVESIRKQGKYIKLDLEYARRLNDYVKEVHEVSIKGEECNPVEVKKGGTRQRLLKGKVDISVDSYLKTDYETRWEGKPIYYLVRVLWEKYVWGSMMDDFSSQCGSINKQLLREVRAYLNLGKFD